MLARGVGSDGCSPTLRLDTRPKPTFTERGLLLFSRRHDGAITPLLHLSKSRQPYKAAAGGRRRALANTRPERPTPSAALYHHLHQGRTSSSHAAAAPTSRSTTCPIQALQVGRLPHLNRKPRRAVCSDRTPLACVPSALVTGPSADERNAAFSRDTASPTWNPTTTCGHPRKCLTPGLLRAAGTHYCAGRETTEAQRARRARRRNDLCFQPQSNAVRAERQKPARRRAARGAAAGSHCVDLRVGAVVRRDAVAAA